MANEEVKTETEVKEEVKEEVETQTTENVESEVEKEENEQVEFDDEDDTSKEDETADSQPKEESKKKQNSKTNKEYAKLRREREQKEAYYKGLKEGIGGTNKYTNEKIETDEDLEYYLECKEMDSKGYDPNSASDYRKFKREKEQELKENEEKELQAKKQQEEEANKRMQVEYKEFQEKYKDVDILKELKENEDMNEAITCFIQSGKTLTESYEMYNKLRNKEVVDTAQKIAEKQVQISQSKNISMTEGETEEEPKDWRSLPANSKEFRDYVEKVKKGQIKI